MLILCNLHWSGIARIGWLRLGEIERGPLGKGHLTSKKEKRRVSAAEWNLSWLK